MPEHIRALIIIISLSLVFFSAIGRPISVMIEHKHFALRRNAWIVLTLSAFLFANFWAYTFLAILLLNYINRYETNPPALFLFLLFALPTGNVEIPGMGIINYFFDLSHTRILTLFILIPALLKLIKQKDIFTVRLIEDKILLIYLLLSIILYLRGSTFSDTLRFAFYQFLDIFLPYIVISRSLKSIQLFKDLFSSLLLAIMLLAFIAIFEFYKHWLLYKPLINVLDIKQSMTGYLGRSDMLRVVATTGHSIVLGYIMTVGLGCYLFLQGHIKKKSFRILGLGLLIIGLIVSLSRGPWIGAGALLIIFIITGRKPFFGLIKLNIIALAILTFISVMPGGARFINLLPFVGTTERENITYREDLLTNSIIVIKQNPIFGSGSYLETPEMEAMRQGQGIIDIVNTYVGIALAKGLVGLALFVCFFSLVVIKLYRSMCLLQDKNGEVYLLGRALLAIILAILLIIFTVSSISVIPTIYWIFAGLGVAYKRMVFSTLSEASSISDSE